MLVIFKTWDEVIVGQLTDEISIIKTYFKEGSRDLDDYNREEAKDLRINAGVDIHTYMA